MAGKLAHLRTKTKLAPSRLRGVALVGGKESLFVGDDEPQLGRKGNGKSNEDLGS